MFCSVYSSSLGVSVSLVWFKKESNMKKGTERKIHVLKLITDIFKEGLVYLSTKYRQISHTCSIIQCATDAVTLLLM